MIQAPLFEPPRVWLPPSELPSLKNASVIALDCETKDPGLIELGPSTFRGGGFIAGVSIATDLGHIGYFPIRHGMGGNLDPKVVLRWLKKELGGQQLKVGANILYDCEWLRHEGVEVRGPKFDVLIAEALLDENKNSYSLETTAQERLGYGKDERALREAIKQYGLKDPKADLWMLHSAHVGAYAEADAVIPLRLYDLQRKLLREEGLDGVMNLEMRLIDVLLDMRFKGVPVDVDKAEIVSKQLQKRANEYLAEIKRLTGVAVDVWSSPSLAYMFDRANEWYPRTAKGNPSFTKEWLESQNTELTTLIVNARAFDRAANAGIRNMILDTAVNGRIHAQFKQTRDDDGGTRSGRFACVNPNLQQISARHPEIGPLVRSLFLPEPGGMWGAFDYSQQEPRVTIHYAYLRKFEGAAEAVKRFRNDPSTDYHQMIADMAVVTRKVAKTINLGLAYGMGIDLLAVHLGTDRERAVQLKAQYDKNVPFIPRLYEDCMNLADQRGYIRTLLGRRCRFNLWEPIKQRNKDNEYSKPLPHEEASKKYGAVKRAGTYKAMNRLIQGSSADMIKQAMVDCFDHGFIPHVTVHDELGFTVTSQNDIDQITHIMLNCVKLEVPLKLDAEIGPTWGDAK